jgi:hypothetical protein
MKARCDNPKQKKWHLYGGRGITYCQTWTNFEVFYAEMGTRPAGHTLERIDRDKGYNRENCKWATATEQNLNLGLRSDNTSGYKGVSWKKQIQRWIARGQIDGISYLLYCGPSFDEAVAARQDWEDGQASRFYS